MGNLRRWHLDAAAPYTFNLAADARLSQTDYADDQVWKFVPGTLEAPALVLQTQYAGRVAIAKLTPVWYINRERRISEHQVYAMPPVVTAFAPAYVQAEGKITPDLSIQTHCHVTESHALMVRHTVTNDSKTPVEISLRILAHISHENRDLPLAIISLLNGTVALSLGRLPQLEPVLLLEGAEINGAGGNMRGEAHISVTVTIPAGEAHTFQYVHAGLEKMNASLERAQFWLQQGWDSRYEAIKTATTTIPDIETGNADFDATIAFSYQQLVQGIMRPTGKLSHASLVLTRKPERGFSARGDGSDHPRGWNGLSAQMTYLLGSAIAPINGAVAKGLLRNFLAVQADDGAIDLAPGLGGQRSGLLALPILARFAWNVYKMTEDIAFLREIYPALLNFFNRWSSPDVDADLDSMPEYQDERQTGYVFWPTFGSREAWAQNADIRLTETPDMAAYLISEAVALSAIARELQDPGAYELTNRIGNLQSFLSRLWRDRLGYYSYQDRDNDAATGFVAALTDARADDEHFIAMDFDVPSRLIVRVSGGSSRVPRATVTLTGCGANGNAQTETLTLSDERWGFGHGTFISQRLYSTLDKVEVEGLSRVFKISVHTVDYTRLDINAVLPLMLGELPKAQTDALIKLLSDPAHFWQPNGVTVVPASDPAYDPSSARGGGGVWLYWVTLIGEGLIDSGQTALATKLVKRVLKAQMQALQKEKHFSEFYHADIVQGLGEQKSLAGIAPLFLLMRVLGVQIVNPQRVYVGGAFHWGNAVTVKQHGVTVTRTDASITVTFPSGYVAKLGGHAEWQLVEDVKAPVVPPTMPEAVIPPQPTETGQAKRVVIEVQHDDEQGEDDGQ